MRTRIGSAMLALAVRTAAPEVIMSFIEECNWVTKYISPRDPPTARMGSEVGIHGENGVDDISAGTADAPGVGALAA
jgi:hypothetical protein